MPAEMKKRHAKLIERAWDSRYAARVEALDDRPISSAIMWNLYRRAWAEAETIRRGDPI
jgi:hypothetical protein